MINEPAFPVLELNHVTGHTCDQHFGMTIRDYFAAKAMQALISAKAQNMNPNSRGWPIFAERDAWLIADAMIAEREKGETK